MAPFLLASPLSFRSFLGTLSGPAPLWPFDEILGPRFPAPHFVFPRQPLSFPLSSVRLSRHGSCDMSTSQYYVRNLFPIRTSRRYRGFQWSRICNVYDLLSLFYGLTFIVLLLPRDHTDRIADNPSNVPTDICIFNCHAQYLVLLIRRLKALSFSARYVIQQYRESDFVSICSFIYLFA